MQHLYNVMESHFLSITDIGIHFDKLDIQPAFVLDIQGDSWKKRNASSFDASIFQKSGRPFFSAFKEGKKMNEPLGESVYL